MKLHSNPASPYGRKVKVVAHETGLFQRLVDPQSADLGRWDPISPSWPTTRWARSLAWCSTTVARSTIRA